MNTLIVNPMTGRKVSIYGKLGQQIIRNYTIVQQGGSDKSKACALNSNINCVLSDANDGNCYYNPPTLRCRKNKTDAALISEIKKSLKAKRRLKKTMRTVQAAVRMKRSVKRKAKFYDVSKIINPDYITHVTPDMEPDMDIRINDYIAQNNIKDGDILFVGDTYKIRQALGFGIVHDHGQFTTTRDVYTSGFRGIIKTVEEYGLDKTVDYTHVLEPIKSCCEQYQMRCHKSF